MKKLILTAMLMTGVMSISKSQSSIDGIYSCVNPLFDNLTNCFSVNDVTGRFSGGGNMLFFQSDVGVQYTQMAYCVDNYNKDRVNCPTSPLLVLGSSSKKKKIAL